MLQLHIESATALSEYNIDDEEIPRISRFCRLAEMNFLRLAGPRNVSVELKYDVLCLLVLVYGIPALVGRINRLNFVLVDGTTCT